MKKNLRISLAKELALFVGRDKVLLAGIVVSKWICVLLGLAAPLLYRFFMNQVIVESRNDRLVYVVLGYVFLYLAMTGVGVMGHFCDNKLKNKLHFTNCVSDSKAEC